MLLANRFEGTPHHIFCEQNLPKRVPTYRLEFHSDSYLENVLLFFSCLKI